MFCSAYSFACGFRGNQVTRELYNACSTSLNVVSKQSTWAQNGIIKQFITALTRLHTGLNVLPHGTVEASIFNYTPVLSRQEFTSIAPKIQKHRFCSPSPDRISALPSGETKGNVNYSSVYLFYSDV